MKVLVTGAGGQVGRALVASCPPEVNLLALDRSGLNIGDEAAVFGVIRAKRPDVVINAAAYTAVDAAESNEDLARRENAEGPGFIARALAGGAGRLIHISTDFVFDGTKRTPYRPDDEPRPLGAYGRTKREGERAVLDALGERAVVMRTAWVYAAQGRNFVRTMLRVMKDAGKVRVVDDQRGSPTTAASLARALWTCAHRPGVGGIFHWTDAGDTTWCGFAAAIAEEAVTLGLLPAPPEVLPITTAEYPTPAVRPAYSVLDTGAAQAALGITPPPWRASLSEVLKEIAIE